MSFKTIKITNHNNTGIICLNNPETLNIIQTETFQEINSALNIFEKDNDIKLILIKAVCGVSKTGQKVFSAGVNLKEYGKKFELADKNPPEFKNFLKQNRKLMTRIEEFNKPVIVAIDGFVCGGFFELALACDLILASKKALFKLNEVNIGLIPGYGGISRLLKIVGKNKTFEIIATCKEINAEEALNLNIISQIFEDADFEKKILDYCKDLTDKSPSSLYLTKNTIYRISKNPDTENIEIENFLKAIQSNDSREGINAFLEKRTPEFL